MTRKKNNDIHVSYWLCSFLFTPMSSLNYEKNELKIQQNMIKIGHKTFLSQAVIFFSLSIRLFYRCERKLMNI